MRLELEQMRISLKEKLQTIESDNPIEELDKNGAKYQFIQSKKRKLIRGINALTSKIKKLKEIDQDVDICRQLDIQYDDLYKKINGIKEVAKVETPEQKKKRNSEFDIEQNEIDDDIQSSIDDLLNGLD